MVIVDCLAFIDWVDLEVLQGFVKWCPEDSALVLQGRTAGRGSVFWWSGWVDLMRADSVVCIRQLARVWAGMLTI